MPNATGITEASFTSKPSGIGQAARAGTARSSACEPNALLVATFWPTLRLRHLRADLDDLAGGLVADDVRMGDQRPAGAVQRVAALDADRLDPDHHALRMALRVGDVLVLQNARTAVLVVDRRFHDRVLPTFHTDV